MGCQSEGGGRKGGREGRKERVMVKIKSERDGGAEGEEEREKLESVEQSEEVSFTPEQSRMFCSLRETSFPVTRACIPSRAPVTVNA